AIRAGVQGIVLIEATIEADGKVGNMIVRRSIPLLDAAAIEAVKQWEYTPTVFNGKAVPIVMTVSVNFAQQPGTPGPPPVPARPPAAPAAAPVAAPARAAAVVAPPPPPIEDVVALTRILDRNHDLDFDKGRQFVQRQQFFEALREFKKANDGGNGRCA